MAVVVRWCRPMILALGVLVSALVLPTRASAQNLDALVIGIDRYVLDAPKNNLEGAVADAQDVAQSLRRLGAHRLVVFLNEQATRAAIEAAWFQMVDTAAPGDTLIFTFAGHGSQEPAPAGASDEPDGLNENFLLSGFTPTGAGFRERIVDDEMNAWLKRADDRGLRVIFVADSCHAGSMTRSLGAVAESRIKFRNIARSTVPLPPAGAPVPRNVAAMKPDDFRNVTFLGAAQEDQKTPEIKVDGKPRGALSYAFARALEGAADTNKDGIVSADELFTFARHTVFKLAETQQTPQFAPLRSASRQLFALTPPKVTNQLPPVSTPPQIPRPTFTTRLKVAVVGGAPPPSFNFAEIVSDPAEADLVWSVADGSVRHRIGGVVAQSITQDLLPAILAKWAALEILKAATAESVAIELVSGNSIYKRGQAVRLTVRSVGKPYLTIFNLPPFGRVDFLEPARRGDATDMRNKVVNKDFFVNEPPFGAEHIVAILSDGVESELHALLAGATTPDKMIALPEALKNLLTGRRIAIGIAPVYTSGAPCRKATEPANCFREY